MKLKDSELKQITGGTKIGLIAALAAAVTFVIGLIDGYVRPLGCR